MLISALIVGCIAAYYFGLRPGAYAAVGAFLLGLVAAVLPRYALAINVCIAIGVFAIWRVGSRRPTPPDSALAIRFVRRGIKRLVAFFK